MKINMRYFFDYIRHNHCTNCLPRVYLKYFYLIVFLNYLPI
ncbi:MAG: hypothetical protein K0Q67_935 [Cellvibrio sp.]|jgi:hypothetical protein|nr:hypothetical protein [Cellvibrio sp.]